MDNHIRILRSQRGWTQADLAAALDVSRQTVNALETGKYDPSLPLAFRISYLFGQPIESIFIDPAHPQGKSTMTANQGHFEYTTRNANAFSELDTLKDMGELGWELTDVGLNRLDFRRPTDTQATKWLYQRLSGGLTNAQKQELAAQGWQFVVSWMGMAFHYFKRPLA
ncbi:hypothetical protein Dxin01_01751 [Deinococcus xinjiangensis]|uniref:HTH cro/C1-type domain-containing protein n=1 Tax=Deinococcus xinjiangensis TaxID=457454 RepID=A0ABP9VE74_9DEIO